jgi:superfamily II DNA/RNA helicase
VGIYDQTGSGKTFAYLIPLVSKIMDMVDAYQCGSGMKNHHIQSDLALDCIAGIIVTPSTELATQIICNIRQILPEELGRICLHLLGGSNIKNQIKRYNDRRPVIIVGTPGRIADLNRLAILSLHKTPLLVFDEADNVIRTSVAKDLKTIINFTGKNLEGGRQTVLSSATLTKKVSHIAISYNWCKNDNLITKKGKTLCSGHHLFVPNIPPGIIHLIVKSAQHRKIEALTCCLMTIDAQNSLVFMTHEHLALETKLRLKTKIRAEILFGTSMAKDKKAILNQLRNGDLNNLILNSFSL